MKLFKKLFLFSLMAFVAISAFGTTAFAQGDDAYDGNTTVILQKRQFIRTEDNQDLPEHPNTGEKYVDNNLGEPYNKEKYGPVTFEMYKLDATQVDGAAGKAPQDIADEVAADKTLYGAALVDTKEVDEHGNVTFDPQDTSTDAYFVILETIKPASVVGPAKPMFIQLPITNKDGTGYLSKVYLQPKNQINPINVDLVKLAHGANSNDAFEGVKFALYKGTHDNHTLVSDTLQTDHEGKVTITDVAVGRYFFVELETVDKVDGLTTDAQDKVRRDGVGQYLASKFAQLDEHNDLWFEVSPTGQLTKSDRLDGFINYMRPTAHKEVDLPNTDKSFTKDQVIPFKVAINVPADIEDYTTFKIEDLPSEGLTLKEDVEVTINGLTRDVDFTVRYEDEQGRRKLVVDFFVGDNMSDTFKAKAGQLIEVKYQASITMDVTEKTEFTNDATLTYSNGGKLRYDKTTETVKTFVKKFVKKDGGRFGLGDGSTLQGAEFLVKNEQNQYLSISDLGVYSWVADREDAKVFVSGQDGAFEVKGLALGTYKLVEIKAPTGYRLPQNLEIEFTVEDPGDTAVVAMDVLNTRGPEMPMTGSEKLVVYGGAAVALAAFALIIIKVRKNKKK